MLITLGLSAAVSATDSAVQNKFMDQVQEH